MNRQTSRYRLALAEPLFTLALPDPVKLRGLTEHELDELAGDLGKATIALQAYDESLGDRLTTIEQFEDPWWAELRPEFLRRGFTPQALDDCVGSASGTHFYYRTVDSDTGKPAPRPGWLDPLLVDIAGRVDPAPLIAAIAENTRAIAALDLGKLDAAIRVVCVFHPFGAPHQVHIANFAELWGMRPVAETKDGSTLYGYGEEGPPAPKAMPWQSGAVRPIVDVRPTEDLEEPLWLGPYAMLLTWIAELCIVIEDRLSPILAARETVEHLKHETGFLLRLEGVAAPSQPPFVALDAALAVLKRLLSGLYEELHHPHEPLVENLAGVLGCLDAAWREPVPEPVKFFARELQRHALSYRRRVAELEDASAGLKIRLAFVEDRYGDLDAEAQRLIEMLKDVVGLRSMSLALRLQVERIEELLGLSFVR